MVAGPIGAAVGAVVGAVAGGLAGHGVAESIDPTAEDAYWRSNYKTRDYATTGDSTYEDYQPAYRAGYTGYATHGTAGRTFDQAEGNLKSDWEKTKGNTQIGWDKAKMATRDAWDRVSNTANTATRQGQRQHDGQRRRPLIPFYRKAGQRHEAACGISRTRLLFVGRWKPCRPCCATKITSSMCA